MHISINLHLFVFFRNMEFGRDVDDVVFGKIPKRELSTSAGLFMLAGLQ